MALYLPQQHMAIDIVDDPCSMPVDLEAFPGFSVIRLTVSQLGDQRLMERLRCRDATFCQKGRPQAEGQGARTSP